MWLGVHLRIATQKKCIHKRLDYVLKICHNITQRCGPSEYNSDMLGVPFESRSPCANFLASHCYSLKECWVLNNVMVDDSRLNSQHNWADLYDHLMSMKMFTLILNNKFIWALKFVKQMDMGTIWVCQLSCTYCPLIACFISYNKWVQRERYLISK